MKLTPKRLQKNSGIYIAPGEDRKPIIYLMLKIYV